MNPNREARLPNECSCSNTTSNGHFDRVCKDKKIIPHPARMPMGLASFFVQFLTAKGGIVLDPFAGSNTTGFVAEKLDRRWVAIDAQSEFVKQSRIRFSDPSLKGKTNGAHSKHRSSKHLQARSKQRRVADRFVRRSAV